MDLSNIHKWPLTLTWQPNAVCLLITVNDTSYEVLMSKEKTKIQKSDQAFLSTASFIRMLKEHIKYYHNDENGESRMWETTKDPFSSRNKRRETYRLKSCQHIAMYRPYPKSISTNYKHKCIRHLRKCEHWANI